MTRFWWRTYCTLPARSETSNCFGASGRPHRTGLASVSPISGPIWPTCGPPCAAQGRGVPHR